jgi:hypothetical protein
LTVPPPNRFVVAPLALGVAVGIFPLALLDALPRALGRPPIMWADSASASVAAIPLAFAYAIFRHVAEDARRAVEITDHAVGALRRSQISAKGAKPTPLRIRRSFKDRPAPL